jgi:hypothetical protein
MVIALLPLFTKAIARLVALNADRTTGSMMQKQAGGLASHVRER